MSTNTKEATAVARTEQAPKNDLERYREYGKLPEAAQAEVRRSRVVREVADMIAISVWGDKLNAVGQVALAKWCISRDVDPLTELDNVGGPYINSEYWIRKLGELRVRGVVDDVKQFNIARDARLEALAKDQNAPEEEREWAKAEHYRRLRRRAEYGVPEEAAGACLTLIYLATGGDPIPGCKWGGNGTSIKQPRSGGGSAPNPIVESNAVLSVESQSIRRAMRQLALTVPGVLPEWDGMHAELKELKADLRAEKLDTDESARQPKALAPGGYMLEDPPAKAPVPVQQREPGEEAETDEEIRQADLALDIEDRKREAKSRDALRDG